MAAAKSGEDNDDDSLQQPRSDFALLVTVIHDLPDTLVVFTSKPSCGMWHVLVPSCAEAVMGRYIENMYERSRQLRTAVITHTRLTTTAS